MLYSTTALRDFSVGSADGSLGRVEDVLFDPRSWAVGYLVVGARDWLFGRDLLLSRAVLETPQLAERLISVRVTRAEVQAEPPPEVVGDNERPPFWALPKGGEGAAALFGLRSARSLLGAAVKAKDGDCGHVEDLVVSDQEWTIAHVAIDTGGWPSGRKVMVEPAAVTAIDWDKRVVDVGMMIEHIRNSPEFTIAGLFEEVTGERSGHERSPLK